MQKSHFLSFGKLFTMFVIMLSSALAARANDTKLTYGSADFQPEPQQLKGAVYQSSNTAVAVMVNGKVHIKGAGAVTITRHLDGVADKVINVEVTPAPLIITANSTAAIIGYPEPPLTVSYSGFVNGDTPASLTSKPTVTIGPLFARYTYVLIPSGAASPNYTFKYVDGYILIAPASVLNFSISVVTYGAANFYPLPQNVPGITFTSTNPAVATIVNGDIHITGAGNANIIISNGFQNIIKPLTVLPAPLTITAVNHTPTRNYGSTATPVFTVTYKGFIKGESTANLTAPATVGTAATASSPAGTYAVNASGAVDNNYAISYVPASLTILPVPLAITAVSQNGIYGSAIPTFTATYSGFVNGDTPASLATAPSIITTATAASPVGIYPVTPAGAVDGNYTITYKAGKFTIGQAPLTISADNKTQVYGASTPALTIAYSGFVNGDKPASLTTSPTISAASASIVGTYPITVKGAVSANYAFTYVQGTLTITPAALSISADNQTRTYGAANPPFTATYTGFVNGDDKTVLKTKPTLVTKATVTTSVGNYPITINGAVDANYTITYKNGTLGITPAVLAVTGVNAVKSYGAANPTFGVSYKGFQNDDAPNNLTTQPIASTTATAASPVGSYTIKVSGGTAKNYTFSYVPATLTINPVPLSITANNQTGVYGSPFPAFTLSFSGLVNGDGPDALGSLLGATTAASAASGVGIYAITPAGAVSANYTIKYVPGKFTITPAALTISADNQTKTYGQPNPVFTITYTGFVNGDGPGSLATQPTIGAPASLYPGTYPITVKAAVAQNYTLTYVPGVLTVNTAVLTITANDQTIPAGSAIPTLTASYSGFVNGDTTQNLTVKPVLSTTATSSSPAGTYPITVGSAASPNYSINFVAGTLTITSAGVASPLVDNAMAPKVNSALSPNGDGKNDVLTIANIEKYPDNKLTLISHNGAKVFELAGYNNTNNAFDGHSNITKAMQQPGTYYYVLQYKDNGVVKSKTGYFVIKY